MKWRFREAERKQSECESECETSDHTRSVFSILTPTLTLLLVVVATLLLSSEAFFDQRSFSEVGGEGGHFLKRVFRKRCNQRFSVLSVRQPAYNTQSGSPTSGLFLLCRFYTEKADQHYKQRKKLSKVSAQYYVLSRIQAFPLFQLYCFTDSQIFVFM
jgi:hypothetical protein